MLPRVVLHNAVSADGRLDGIEPDLKRFYALAGTWKEQATLAGSDTLLASGTPPDEPRDLAWPGPRPGDRRPLLVVPDSRGRVRCWQALRRFGFWRDAVALVSRETPQKYLDYLRARRVESIRTGRDRVDLPAALEELAARYKVRLVRADCGGTLNGVLLRLGLVSEVSLMVVPRLVGGTTPRSMFLAPDVTSPAQSVKLGKPRTQVFPDGTLWLRYRVQGRRRARS